MNHKSKHLIDKSKSFNNLEQSCCFKQTEHIDNSFLNEFEKISQHGQNNCGIFVSNDKTRLIKCNCGMRNGIENKLVKIKESYPEFEIFPEIYNIHKFNNKIYTEMDKFDGDLTNLLYEILPRHILKNKVKDGKITYDELNKYYELFQMFIDKTYDDKLNPIYCSKPIISYLIKNRDALPKIINISEENYKIYRKNGNKEIGFKKFNDIQVGIFGSFDKQMKTYDKLVKFFSDGIIKYTIYFEFIEEYKKQFSAIFEGIKKQILRLQLLLYKIGLKYDDMNLDNFAYRLSELNHPHLGMIWSNNIFLNDKYLFISILDWDSGLNDRNSTPESIIRLCNDFYSRIYGQNKFKNICSSCPILRDCDNSVLNLNEDGFKILSSEYKLEDSKYYFKSIEEVNTYVNEDNEVLFDIKI